MLDKSWKARRSGPNGRPKLARHHGQLGGLRHKVVEPQSVEALGQRIGRIGVSLEECLFRDPSDERATEREGCI